VRELAQPQAKPIGRHGGRVCGGRGRDGRADVCLGRAGSSLAEAESTDVQSQTDKQTGRHRGIV